MMKRYGKSIVITVFALSIFWGISIHPVAADNGIRAAMVSTTATATATDDSDKRTISAEEKEQPQKDKAESKKPTVSKSVLRKSEETKPAASKPAASKPAEPKPVTGRVLPPKEAPLPADRNDAKPPVVGRTPSPVTPVKRPQPYPVKEARIRIYSRPGNAAVYIDDVFKGHTLSGGPLLLTEREGKHTVKLILSGYLEWSKSVMLRFGTIFEIVADLAPQPGYGGLQISTYPAGTDIYLDGRLVGNSGSVSRLDITGISEGEHRLTGRTPGFKEANAMVRVHKNSITKVSLVLSYRHTDSLEGELVIISSPGKVAVYVDNRFAGITSWGGYLLISRLTPGYHYIRAYLQDYRVWESWVLISNNGVSNLHIHLERESFMEPRYYKYSGISLHCNISGARVYLDGSYVGLTDYGGDLGLYDLSAGEHELRLTRTGYQDWVRRIDLEAGRTRDVDVHLVSREQIGSLSIDCNMPNAEVYLDDEYLDTITNGDTALFERISAGRYNLVVRADGYEDYSRMIEINAEERLQLEVKMARSSRAGSLEILADPLGASVMIDGQSMGVAPRKIDDIAEGEHEVLLLAAGYIEWRSIVRIESGKETSVHAVLVRERSAAAKAPVPPPVLVPPTPPVPVPPVTPEQDVIIITGSSPSVYINGRQVETDIAPVITAGRVMVPLRGVFQTLGAIVIWNSDTKTVICNAREKRVALRLGSREASVNGKTYRIDAPPILKNGRVLVPLRFISEALAADVRWDGNLKRVYIETESN
jgi:hypothetical protein